jgi:hypothetical protein
VKISTLMTGNNVLLDTNIVIELFKGNETIFHPLKLKRQSEFRLPLWGNYSWAPTDLRTLKNILPK